MPAAFAALLAASATAAAQEQKKQPPPEFSTGYAPPAIVTPSPRAEVFSTIDVVVLLAMLGLTAWLSLRRRNRRELRVVVLFSALYFGFYRLGCVCSVGSIQNVVYALFDSRYALPFTVGAFFLLPLVFALFTGRVFCAAVCPLGAIQDLVLWKPRKVPASVDHALGLLPYVYLGAGVLFAATGSAFVICQYDPFIGFFRFGGNGWVVGFGVLLLAIGTVIGRPYCRYLCPYGVLLRWMSVFARWRVRITPAECIQCHLCADECPFGAIRPPAPPETAHALLIGRKRLARLIAWTPAIVALFSLLGYLAAPKLSRVNHTVSLADRVWAEERGRVTGTTDESTAFAKLGVPNSQLYRDAVSIRRKFDLGCALLGAWIGLVIALKMVFLSIHRGRTDYEADQAGCYSCARCYMSCPVEHERLGLVSTIPLSALAATAERAAQKP